MAQTLTRLYANKSDADAAVADLTKRGFAPEEIFVVGPPDASAAADEADEGKPRSRKKGARQASSPVAEEIAEAIAAGRILNRHADTYAKKVAEGAALVSVHAAFGTGFKAASILDRHNPVESGVASATKPAVKYDERFPLSSGLRMGTRVDDPTPFGTFWNVPTLWSCAAPLSTWLKYDTVVDSPAPISNLFGWPVLTDKGATLSALLGLPMLINRL
jgi:hypothetical protein